VAALRASQRAKDALCARVLHMEEESEAAAWAAAAKDSYVPECSPVCVFNLFSVFFCFFLCCVLHMEEESGAVAWASTAVSIVVLNIFCTCDADL
jgi:hypothetical protein